MIDREAILRMSNLTKSFEGLKVVDLESIEIVSGRITGLIGPNGAGKTTIFNLISGLLRPDRGEIWFEDRRIDTLPPWEIARMGIGRLFQDIRIFRKLSVLDNILLGDPNHPGENPLNLFLDYRNIIRIERKNLKETEYWIEFVGLKGKERSPAGSLSFGQQKLLAIARLISGGHKLLLLDEPTAGVNPMMIKQILSLIERIAKEGKTVLFIEHNMNVVLEIADWVYFLDEGRVTSFGRPQEVLGDPEVRKMYLGL